MKIINTFKLLKEDWKRYLNCHKNKNFFVFVAAFFHNPGMMFSLMYRVESYLWFSPFKFVGFLLYPIYYVINFIFFDFMILPSVKIGGGLYLHNKGIYFGPSKKIGKNLTILGPVTVGVDLNGKDSAIIGDNVTLCTGARIIGNIKIGNNVIVAANAVVNKDVPNNVIVGGIPAKVIKKNDKVLNW